MIGLFRRASAAPTGTLGSATVAVRVPSGTVVPKNCVGLVYDGGGRMRRAGAGNRLQAVGAELACCFHPGPYQVDLQPYASAPECGLQLRFAVDAPDPRLPLQRFDLYLAGEVNGELSLEEARDAMETALRRELELGGLDLPPCTSIAEWNQFRAGLNQLLYTRFGVMVDDCLPVDLGDRVDYARSLRERAQARIAQQAAAPAFDPAMADARALRRLFLELPSVMAGLRQAPLSAGCEAFQRHRALMQQLDAVNLSIGTMPALALEAPGVALDAPNQVRRARRAMEAVTAMDEAWGLLARLQLAGESQVPALLEDADRIAANLALAVAGRRAAREERHEA
jgi:hypothetical protein